MNPVVLEQLAEYFRQRHAELYPKLLWLPRSVEQACDLRADQVHEPKQADEVGDAPELGGLGGRRRWLTEQVHERADDADEKGEGDGHRYRVVTHEQLGKRLLYNRPMKLNLQVWGVKQESEGVALVEVTLGGGDNPAVSGSGNTTFRVKGEAGLVDKLLDKTLDAVLVIDGDGIRLEKPE